MLEKLEINNSCVPCASCTDICPEKAIYAQTDLFVINNSACTQCGLCLQVCPVDAIKLISKKQ